MKKLAGDKDPLVRIAAVTALGKIASAHTDRLATILPVLEQALDAEEDTVKGAGVAAVSMVANRLGKRRADLIAKLIVFAEDRNPLLAAQSQRALRDAFRLPARRIPKGP